MTQFPYPDTDNVRIRTLMMPPLEGSFKDEVRWQCSPSYSACLKGFTVHVFCDHVEDQVSLAGGRTTFPSEPSRDVLLAKRQTWDHVGGSSVDHRKRLYEKTQSLSFFTTAFFLLSAGSSVPRAGEIGLLLKCTSSVTCTWSPGSPRARWLCGSLLRGARSVPGLDLRILNSLQRVPCGFWKMWCGVFWKNSMGMALGSFRSSPSSGRCLWMGPMTQKIVKHALWAAVRGGHKTTWQNHQYPHPPIWRLWVPHVTWVMWTAKTRSVGLFRSSRSQSPAIPLQRLKYQGLAFSPHGRLVNSPLQWQTGRPQREIHNPHRKQHRRPPGGHTLRF